MAQQLATSLAPVKEGKVVSRHLGRVGRGREYGHTNVPGIKEGEDEAKGQQVIVLVKGRHGDGWGVDRVRKSVLLILIVEGRRVQLKSKEGKRLLMKRPCCCLGAEDKDRSLRAEVE